MKNKIWRTIKTKRFLYALLTSVLLFGFAVGSSRFWEWLIPWRPLEIVVWFVIYFGLLAIVMINFDKWYDKHCN